MSSHHSRPQRLRNQAHPIPARPPQQQQSGPPQPHPFDLMYQNYTPTTIITARPPHTIQGNQIQKQQSKNGSVTSRNSDHVSRRTPDAGTRINLTKHDPPGRRWSRDQHVLTESPTPTTTPPPPPSTPHNNKPTMEEECDSSLRHDVSTVLNDPKSASPEPTNQQQQHQRHASAPVVTVPEHIDNKSMNNNSNNNSRTSDVNSSDTIVPVAEEQESHVPTATSIAATVTTTSPAKDTTPATVTTMENESNSTTTATASTANDTTSTNDATTTTTATNSNNSNDKENTPAADPVATAKFLTSIRNEFWDCPDVYDSFVDIMRAARTQNVPLSETVSRVQKILHGKQQLIEAFDRLLPADHHINDGSREDMQQRGRSSSPSGTQAPAPITSAFHFINLVKTRFAEKPDVYQKFAQLLESYSCKRISLAMMHNEVRSLFAFDSHLLAEFSKFMPLQAESVVLGRRLSNDRESVASQHSKKHKVYRGDKKLPFGWEHSPLFTRIKTLLGNDITYTDFVKLVGLYNQGALDLGTTVRVSSEYLKSDANLLKEFKALVGYLELSEISELKSVHDDAGNGSTNDKTSVSDDHPLSSVRGSVEPVYREPRMRQSSVNTQRSDRSKSASAPVSSARRITLYELATRRGSGKSAGVLFDDDMQCSSSLSGTNTSSEYGPGPSYRRIPRSYQKSKCSGRDSLCNEALNDEYASHPIWASEENGFITSKKNIYEEALHRAEDERYYEDRCIDSGVSTIGLLQHIQDTLNSLPASQVSSYRPPKYLGGGTEMVYKPALTKIYDKKQVNEIIHMLHNSPAQTVPTVLKKLTSKVEEWKQKKVQADKNRKTSETENFYKALDNRSNTFKQIDKKSLSIKSLVSEIEALSFEQHDKDTKHNRNSQAQLCYDFKDLDIISDITQLIEVFNKNRVIYSSVVKEAMEQFISKFFLPIMKVEGFEPLLSEDPDVLPCTADGVFVNDNLYCFFRIFQIVYYRLEMAKTISQQYSLHPKKTKHKNCAQIDLTSNKVRHHGVDLEFENGCYAIMLTLIERLLKGEIDQGTYEACARYMFGLKAYMLFTLDKVLTSLSHQLYMAATEPDCRSYVDLYVQEDSRIPEENLSSLQLYKLKAESLRKGNENQYMIVSTLGAAGGTTLSISLLGTDVDKKESEDYKDYVAEFMDWEKDSPSVDRAKMNAPFLQRNARRVRRTRRNMQHVLESGHEYKICQNTYRIFHVIGKEDYLRVHR